MDHKIKAVTAALQRDRDLYHNTGNAHHAWHAWQLARQAGVSIPEWVARFVDGIATRAVTERSRKVDAADRYEAALTAMEAAVKRHGRRLKIRKIGKQFGVDVPISRRDRPNLTAIARVVAKDHRVSVNRLLSLPETPSALLRRSDPSSGSPAGNSRARNRAATSLGQRLNSGRATDKYVVCCGQACVN
jgi:hypothetical protein